MRVIRRYPNRRLYDMSESKYINLGSIKNLIKDHVDFKIIDSKSEKDATRLVLLQIINESETNASQSLLTSTLLMQLIRFYGSDMENFVGPYLENSVAQFIEQQDSLQGIMNSVIANGPIGLLSQMIEKQMAHWNPQDKNKK